MVDSCLYRLFLFIRPRTIRCQLYASFFFFSNLLPRLHLRKHRSALENVDYLEAKFCDEDFRKA